MRTEKASQIYIFLSHRTGKYVCSSLMDLLMSRVMQVKEAVKLDEHEPGQRIDRIRKTHLSALCATSNALPLKLRVGLLVCAPEC